VGASAVYFTKASSWTADVEAVRLELERIGGVPFFRIESNSVQAGELRVIGVLSRHKKYGGVESLRVELVYPAGFPEVEPEVFDYDGAFEPSSDGHQYPNRSLCLSFPLRKEFSFTNENLTLEVLGAALNWMVKRNIFERSNPKRWPEEAEPHGWGPAYKALLIEQARNGDGLLEAWIDWAITVGARPNWTGECPCLSGRAIRSCHRELAASLEVYLNQNGIQRK
jgi:hypothetical protein